MVSLGLRFPGWRRHPAGSLATSQEISALFLTQRAKAGQEGVADRMIATLHMLLSEGY